MICKLCGTELEPQPKQSFVDRLLKPIKYVQVCKDCVQYQIDIINHNTRVQRTLFKRYRDTFYAHFLGNDELPFLIPQLDTEVTDTLLNSKPEKKHEKEQPNYIG